MKAGATATQFMVSHEGIGGPCDLVQTNILPVLRPGRVRSKGKVISNISFMHHCAQFIYMSITIDDQLIALFLYTENMMFPLLLTYW